MNQSALIPIVILAIVCAGCGSESEGTHQKLKSMITFIDNDGEQTEIPASELVDPTTGQPTVQAVLVVERQTNKTGFVEATKLKSQPLSALRYIPVTIQTYWGG